MKKILIAFVLAGFTACERPAADDELATDSVALDTATAPDTAARSGDTTATAMQRGPVVDANALSIGDAVAGLRLAEKRIEAAPASPLGVTGSLSFDGEIELTGSYRAHFDYPDVREPCFWVDLRDWEKLPRVKGDERLKWFCFENDADAIRQLGALGSETRATIVIDDYTTNLQQSDVWDTARLVRVVKKGLEP